MLWQKQHRQGLFLQMIQIRDKEQLKPCVHGQRESGTYFVSTALHTGTQTRLPHVHTFLYTIPPFCIALYLQQQFPNSVGSSWYHCSQAETQRTESRCRWDHPAGNCSVTPATYTHMNCFLNI